MDASKLFPFLGSPYVNPGTFVMSGLSLFFFGCGLLSIVFIIPSTGAVIGTAFVGTGGLCWIGGIVLFWAGLPRWIEKCRKRKRLKKFVQQSLRSMPIESYQVLEKMIAEEHRHVDRGTEHLGYGNDDEWFAFKAWKKEDLLYLNDQKHFPTKLVFTEEKFRDLKKWWVKR